MDADALRPRRARSEPGFRVHVEGAADRRTATKSRCGFRSRASSIQSADEQSWDLNVVRQVQHSGYEDSWAPAKRVERVVPRRRPERSTDSTGLRSRPRARPESGRDAEGDRRAGRRAAGATRIRGRSSAANVRWGITNNLTLNGTVRSGFRRGRIGRRPVRDRSAAGAVLPREAAVLPRGARAVQRAAQPHLHAAHRASRKRRSSSPAKSPARASAFSRRRTIRVLSPNGRDTRRSTTLCARSATSADNRASAWRTPIASSAATTTASRTSTGAWCSARCTAASFQYAQSYDKTRGVVRNAPLWDGIFARNGKRFGFRYVITGIDERFPRAERIHLAPGHRARRDRSSRDVVQRARIAARDADRRHSVRRHVAVLAFRASGRRAGQEVPREQERGSARRLDVGAGVYWETFGYDTQLFRNYRIERTVGTKVDTIPFVGVGRIPNRDYVADAARRRSGRASTRRCSTSAARTRTSSSGRRRTSTTSRSR